jgi:hypothetical protein
MQIFLTLLEAIGRLCFAVGDGAQWLIDSITKRIATTK